MRIETSAGELVIRAHPLRPGFAIAAGEPDVLQAVLDGIEMSYAVEPEEEPEELPERTPYGSLVASKRQLATWIQFEILNYLT